MDEHDLEPTRIHDEDLTRIHRTPPIHGKPPEQEALPSEPSLIGRYTLHRSLGVGAFAKVYLAEDDTGHLVALKRLLPGVASSSEIVRRFRSVAERSRALKHPNIITVYGYEVVGEGPAIVMEYVPGQSLRQALRERGILPVDEALDVALQLCDALAYAHDTGFVHRDVKPDNVLVTPEGMVKLGDFDIAKI
ncbi:MAG: serine/threonine protein kinase, partial [Chloroflexi bacterium]|nr:serine/threonine protein kinase [Chloroflexota bacterium]